MEKLTDQQIQEYKEAFNLFDRDGDACITTEELGTVIRALGKNPTEAEVKQIIREVDPDGRGLIDFTEFKGIMSRDLRTFDAETDLKAAWKVFDKDNVGYVIAAELKHVLANIGEKLPEHELDELIKEADPDNDGKIHYDDFLKMLTAK